MSGVVALGVTVIVVFCLDKCGISTRWGMIFGLAVGMGSWLIFRERLLKVFGLALPKKGDK